MNASIITWLTQRWRLLLVILTPLVLLPLPILINNPQGRCGYVVIILSIYWITEAIPLPVTSLLPLILFPMAGVLTAEVVAPHYFKDIIALFFGSMAFGYAVESVNLHRRIALFVLSWVGTGTKWIMAGLMGATAFLSMWINNTASTSIMLPVTLAIVDELSVYNKNSLDRRQRFLLAIAYSSSIGGLSSLVGTTPNIYLKGFIDSHISDGTVAIFCGILPLILPDSNPFNRRHDWKYEPIVKWTSLVQNISWGAIILLGAGLSLASAFQTSMLSESVAKALGFISNMPQAAAIIIIVVISGFFTEVTSNLSTATIFFPVLDSVATSSGIHPAFLILPCTLAVSLAFMLPIATPPNAIVFASGAIRVIDMIKTGIVMNLIGFLVIFLVANTWMPKIFDLNDQTTAIFLNMTTRTI
ncbi:unnamed protein product [Adineta steineri]|uniref:Citrate transporter-like domain-containing protein n=1 Tax=Adineta steineri TaxID=433720 RepID=A0A814UY62_9BILA|nr:unnamed protein product [Adineta steineri]CAF1414804.1 unnamed protein product [Adineta steineri]